MFSVQAIGKAPILQYKLTSMKIFNILFKVLLLLAIASSAYFYIALNRYTYGAIGVAQTKTDRLTGDVYLLKFDMEFMGVGPGLRSLLKTNTAI